MQRDVFSFPLPRSIKIKLSNAKLITVYDILSIASEDVIKEAGLTQEEVDCLHARLRLVTGEESSLKSITALQLGVQEREARIGTFSRTLDELLGEGGIEVGRLLEICGQAGSGKTQLCLQLAVAVQIPKSCNAAEGECLYIDTEGSFTAERLIQIANEVIRHNYPKIAFYRPLHNVNTSNEHQECNISVASILAGIHYFRCLSQTELMAIVGTLEDFIASHPKVKLILIDNITSHFRQNETTDFKQRARVLFDFCGTLFRIAHRLSLAVVVTNQVTTRFRRDGRSYLAPALGDKFAYICSQRIFLTPVGKHGSDVRKALTFKSYCSPPTIAYFKISEAGIQHVVVTERIRGVDHNSLPTDKKRNCPNYVESRQSLDVKRPRKF